MSHLHSSNRPVHAAHHGAISLLVLLGLVAVFAQPAVADPFYSEEHVLTMSVEDPAWESVHTYSVDLPLFDPLGGARTLIGYEVDFAMGSFYTKEVAANPTADVVGCENKWGMTWKAELNGVVWFPWDQPSGEIGMTMGYGAIRPPFSEYEPPVEDGGYALGMVRACDEPSRLTQVTGVGTVSLDCTHTLSELTVSEPYRWPGVPGVFVPELLTTTMDELVARATVTYFYTPEPSTLALLGVGAMALIRRRR